MARIAVAGALMTWGRPGDVLYLPKMRTQLVAARTVAEALARLALSERHAGRPDLRGKAGRHALTQARAD